MFKKEKTPYKVRGGSLTHTSASCFGEALTLNVTTLHTPFDRKGGKYLSLISSSWNLLFLSHTLPPLLFNLSRLTLSCTHGTPLYGLSDDRGNFGHLDLSQPDKINK